MRHSCYAREPSQPFRLASIDYIQCGEAACRRDGKSDFPGANLGLYSVTYVNELEQDRQALLWYKEFREEAERKNLRHFLEVFDPDVDSGVPPEKLGEFINDNILRTLAGVPESGRPLFLKNVYNGPKAMEELTQYNSNLVVGILGGNAGTTYDAFKLIHDAQKYGARVALFGRKISPEEAVRAFHGVLQGKGIKPDRLLEADLVLTDQAKSYDGSASRRAAEAFGNSSLAQTRPTASVGEIGHHPSPISDWPKRDDGSPDFGNMSSTQRLGHDHWRMRRFDKRVLAGGWPFDPRAIFLGFRCFLPC